MISLIETACADVVAANDAAATPTAIVTLFKNLEIFMVSPPTLKAPSNHRTAPRKTGQNVLDNIEASFAIKLLPSGRKDVK